MPDTPRFGVRFLRPGHPDRAGAGHSARSAIERVKRAEARAQARAEARAPIERHDRVPLYLRAVDLAARSHAVIEAAEAERFFLRDQLDRKSSLVPQLIAQGLALAEMPARRALYRQARRAVTDCAAIFDMLLERGSAPREPVEAARTLALALVDELLALGAEPPKVW